MSKDKEPTVTINGIMLTEAQAMTVRVAIESFAMSLKSDGLGDDAHGKEMVKLYGRRINDIRRFIFSPPVRTPNDALVEACEATLMLLDSFHKDDEVVRGFNTTNKAEAVVMLTEKLDAAIRLAKGGTTMIRAVIDQAAFEQLVADKPATVQLTERDASGGLLTSRSAELILSDIWFPAMLDAIQRASGGRASAFISASDWNAALEELLSKLRENVYGGIGIAGFRYRERGFDYYVTLINEMKIKEATPSIAEDVRHTDDLPEDHSDYCVERDKERRAGRGCGDGSR